MAEGHKAIEEIQAGDEVLAMDYETGEVAFKEVVQIFVNETEELIHVHVNGEKISTTPNHPFYVAKFGWTSAINLRAGDVLVLSNGEYVLVEAIQHEILESPIKVYNFEVEEFHTYFVGETGVLVHNDCGTKGTPTKDNHNGRVKSNDGNPPTDFSPEGSGRKGAFREAKRASGIPVTEQPTSVTPAVGNNGKHIPGRDYKFSGDKTIREHFGHIFPDNPTQNRGFHFNDVFGNHYDF